MADSNGGESAATARSNQEGESNPRQQGGAAGQISSASIPAAAAAAPPAGGTYPRPTNFGEKLMHVLENGIAQDCISWHGETCERIAIHLPNLKKSSVLNTNFQGNRYSSFVRNLNRWGFRRIHALETNPLLVYYNSLFNKAEPELVRRMKMDSDVQDIYERTELREKKRQQRAKTRSTPRTNRQPPESDAKRPPLSSTETSRSKPPPQPQVQPPQQQPCAHPWAPLSQQQEQGTDQNPSQAPNQRQNQQAYSSQGGPNAAAALGNLLTAMFQPQQQQQGVTSSIQQQGESSMEQPQAPPIPSDQSPQFNSFLGQILQQHQDPGQGQQTVQNQSQIQNQGPQNQVLQNQNQSLGQGQTQLPNPPQGDINVAAGIGTVLSQLFQSQSQQEREQQQQQQRQPQYHGSHSSVPQVAASESPMGQAPAAQIYMDMIQQLGQQLPHLLSQAQSSIQNQSQGTVPSQGSLNEQNVPSSGLQSQNQLWSNLVAALPADLQTQLLQQAPSLSLGQSGPNRGISAEQESQNRCDESMRQMVELAERYLSLPPSERLQDTSLTGILQALIIIGRQRVDSTSQLPSQPQTRQSNEMGVMLPLAVAEQSQQQQSSLANLERNSVAEMPPQQRQLSQIDSNNLNQQGLFPQQPPNPPQQMEATQANQGEAAAQILSTLQSLLGGQQPLQAVQQVQQPQAVEAPQQQQPTQPQLQVPQQQPPQENDSTSNNAAAQLLEKLAVLQRLRER
ncbi:expressed unknown protein [Seminavis robusta]|uniref:HSF-type DNA-binding domain-containing protein n=1 Tax=Seminavis robusta TaxID=568900 RepID=A0A9N8HMG3_9STRA|nr:expressed unknown protein [Seminavis robusta]|eukprot:Sro896_g217400.1 n/a (735) ;mRNA; f:35526-37917